MERPTVAREIKYILLFLLIFIVHIDGLKCRTEDGPSEAELKRVGRNCMRKIGENMSFTNGEGSMRFSATGNNYNKYTNNNDQQYQENDSPYKNNANGNYNDYLRERFHNRKQFNRSTTNDNNEHYGRSSSSSGSSNNSNGNNRQNGQIPRNFAHKEFNNGSDGGYNKSHTRFDHSCVAHCFFEEMNMLNNDNYADINMVTYVLTKDIRDSELRLFYTDAIQGCFHYTDNQRQLDKCQHAREIVRCMTEYVMSNCEDLQQFNLVFN